MQPTTTAPITSDPAKAKRFATEAQADAVSCETYVLPGCEALIYLARHPHFKTGWCVMGFINGATVYLDR